MIVLFSIVRIRVERSPISWTVPRTSLSIWMKSPARIGRSRTSWMPANRFFSVSCRARPTARAPTPSVVMNDVMSTFRVCSTVMTTSGTISTLVASLMGGPSGRRCSFPATHASTTRIATTTSVIATTTIEMAVSALVARKRARSCSIACTSTWIASSTSRGRRTSGSPPAIVSSKVVRVFEVMPRSTRTRTFSKRNAMRRRRPRNTGIATIGS